MCAVLLVILFKAQIQLKNMIIANFCLIYFIVLLFFSSI